MSMSTITAKKTATIDNDLSKPMRKSDWDLYFVIKTDYIDGSSCMSKSIKSVYDCLIDEESESFKDFPADDREIIFNELAADIYQALKATYC